MDELNLVIAHLDRELSDVEHARLVDWLNHSPDNVRAFVEWSVLQATLDEHYDTYHLPGHATTGLSSSTTQENEFLRMLDHIRDHPPAPRKPGLARRLTEFGTVVGYLALQGLRTRPGMISAVAAVLALGAVLFFSMYNGPAPQPQNVAEQTPTPQAPQAPLAPKAPAIVATLTAEHNAAWSRRPGQDLYAGQRLTLTAGYAEITTARGAVAILEAPATIELLDSDNALRLHTGKLVGICETDSSKGFLVRTPRIDVIDLGTRFGVHASPRGGAVSVMTGEVKLTSASGTSQLLSANQTAKINSNGETPEWIVHEQISKVFDALLASPMLDSLARFRPRFDGEAMDWGGHVPQDLRAGRQISQNPKLFLERQNVLLEQDLPVDLSADVRLSGQNTPATQVDAGQRVDVYLLHLELPVNSEMPPTDYVIRFDRPIVGVIASGEKLVQTDALLGAPGVQYPVTPTEHDITGRGLELQGEFINDELRLDGQVLYLNLSLITHGDQLRILVQAAPDTDQ